MEILPGVLELPLWSILAVVIAALLYMYSTRNYKIWSAQGIKGPIPRPFLGTFHLELKAGCFGNCDLDFVKQYGKIFGGFRSSSPMLCVADPEFLRQAYIKEFAAMPNRSDLKMNAISDTMLISLTDDRWKHVRGAISPTFTTGKLKQMVRRIQDCSVKLVDHIAQFDDEPFDAKDSVGSYTMDVISSTAFGIQMDSRANPNHPMIWHAKEMMGLNKKGGLADLLNGLKIFILFVISPRWMPKYLTRLGFDIFDQKSTEYFKNIVDQVITSRDEPANKDADFVQLCLDKVVPDPMKSDSGSQQDKYGALWTPKGLARDELVGNAILFFVAGYETTASTLHYAMFELAWNQDVQEKAVEEINKIMGDRPVIEQPTYDELNQMEYLEWVLNETMRLYPAAPRVERLTERECTIEGITIPKGSIVDACVYAIHHDPEHWPEPFKFDPERYSPENKKTRHQYAWIPFGMGMRNCIGMRLAMLEMKIGLIAILRSCKLETCEQTLKRSSDRPIRFAKTMRIDPEEDIIIKASRRLA